MSGYVVVLGSTGFIGGVVQARLRQEELKTRSVSAPRLVSRSVDLTGLTADLRRCTADMTALARSLEGVDVVVNAAGAASPDCVFSGGAGVYTEHDAPDATDLHGRSKLLCEVDGEGAVTLRTSIIGRKLGGGTPGRLVPGAEGTTGLGVHRSALLRPNDGRAFAGYWPRRAGTWLAGLWHLAAQPNSKCELLIQLERRLQLGVRVSEDASVAIDRTLDATLFQGGARVRSADLGRHDSRARGRVDYRRRVAELAGVLTDPRVTAVSDASGLPARDA